MFRLSRKLTSTIAALAMLFSMGLAGTHHHRHGDSGNCTCSLHVQFSADGQCDRDSVAANGQSCCHSHQSHFQHSHSDCCGHSCGSTIDHHVQTANVDTDADAELPLSDPAGDHESCWVCKLLAAANALAASDFCWQRIDTCMTDCTLLCSTTTTLAVTFFDVRGPPSLV